MRLLKICGISIVALLFVVLCSCEQTPYTTGTVCKVENMLISYRDWLCRSAVIDEYPWHCKYPLQYQEEIKTGTNIRHQCDSMVAYKSINGWVEIDWEKCKRVKD